MGRWLSLAESGPNNRAHAVWKSNCFTLPRLRSLARPAVVSPIEDCDCDENDRDV